MRFFTPAQRLAALLLLSPLLGLSCVLPQRTHSILPPTNERILCQEDNRFYYSQTYDFCFRYPSDVWQAVTRTGSRTIPDTSITGNTFSLPIMGVAHPVFTLYVTAYAEEQRQSLLDQGLTIVYDADPYVIAYAYAQTFPPELESLKPEINSMLRTINVFAPPAGRK